MTPSTVQEHAHADAPPSGTNASQRCFGEDAPAPEVSANIARYVHQHEDCQLDALDDEPGI
ncbi:MAG TPA: hypothetical protein VH231_00715 [Solirubrobacteraceae bacterium]|jgi:hypothetical protein|nr:hypothetical protein [Solirubrobacteraceae bacterium]